MVHRLPGRRQAMTRRLRRSAIDRSADREPVGAVLADVQSGPRRLTGGRTRTGRSRAALSCRRAWSGTSATGWIRGTSTNGGCCRASTGW